VNKEMLDLAAVAIKTAKAAGADGCSAEITNDRTVEISYRERKPETIKEASTRDLLVKLYVNGRYSAQGTSDLRPEALKTFISNAVATTRLLAEDPFRTLPDPKYYAGRAELDLGLVDPAHAKLTPADRHEWARALEDAALKRGGDKVISATAQVQDSHAEDVLLTSNGFEGSSESTSYVASVQVTAQDAGDRRPMGYSYRVALSRKDLPPAEGVGIEAAERTLAMFGGRKIKTETLPIIVENRNGGRILGALLQAMIGRQVQQKQSFLADKKGQKIGSELLTLVDDPLLPKGLGSRLFDGDGIAARRRTMIEAGVLKEFYVDWYYSRKLGWEPTTGGPSNLVIPPGKRSVKEIMKGLGRGVLVTDFIGGNANSTTGDASMGIIGTLFDEGEPVQAVAEMNIAGNTVEFWSRLVEVGNDPWPYSSMRLPSLVFKDVVVSGV
jgi:PmbA protein